MKKICRIICACIVFLMIFSCFASAYVSAAASSADFVGYQLQNTSTDTYSMRFLAVLKGTQTSEAGFNISIAYSSGSKQFNRSVNTAYAQILASSGGDSMEAVTAASIGGDYIIALTVTDIPKNIGEITITASAYSVKGGVRGQTQDAVFTYDPTTQAQYSNVQMTFEKEAEALKNTIIDKGNTYSAADVTGLGKCYYVSYSEGDDSNDGLSPEAPWKTIDKVSQASFSAGCVVLFKRGDEWRLDSYEQSKKATYLLLKSGVIYSSYGEGPKPIINGSPVDAAKEGTWTAVQGYINVWKYSRQYAGMYQNGSSTLSPALDDVGNIFFNGGEAYGKKMVTQCSEIPFSGLADLDAEYEFWYNPDDDSVYLYCDQNPAAKYDSIEMGVRLNLVRCSSNGSSYSKNVVFDNFTVKNGGAHGVTVALTQDMSITNCEIGWIGGGVYSYDVTGNYAQYGNGIEIGRDCKNITVENNYIYQCYDAGVTHQFDSDTSDVTCFIENISYSRNVIDRCQYSVEYFVSPSVSYPTTARYMKDISITHNYLMYAGYGFGYYRKPSGQPGATHIKGWNLKDSQVSNPVIISGNRIIVSKHDMAYTVCYNPADIPEYSNNVFIQLEGCKTITLGYTEVTAANRKVWNVAELEANTYLKNKENKYITVTQLGN